MLACQTEIQAHEQATSKTEAASQKSSQALPWYSQAWGKDDKPLIQVRDALNKAIKDGQPLEKLLEQYKKQATERPEPVSVFCLAYCVYKWSQGRSLEQVAKNIADVLSAFRNTDHYSAYEYSRLRFLLECTVLPSSTFKDLGQRLAEHNPTDYDSKFYLVAILVNSNSNNWKAFALPHAHDLTKLQPSNPSAYSSLGSVYAVSWLSQHNE